MNKELPKNIEAEKCLLGSMFWSRESLQRGCEEADKDIFYLDSHSKIFEAIKQLYLNDTPVDITSVTTYLININKIVSLSLSLKQYLSGNFSILFLTASFILFVSTL